MSGVVKGIGKVFKGVAKFVKKALPYVAIAAAVYFTAGVALSAFPSTAAFAASMPGFAGGGFLGLGIGAGATAGTGLFSQAAAAIGLGTLGSAGGLVGGAMAAGTTAAQLGAASAGLGTAAAGLSSAGAAASSAASIGAGAYTAAGGMGPVLPPGVITTVPSVTGPAAAKAGLSIGEQLLLASTGASALGALTAPTPAEQKRFVGSFYGTDRKGGGGPIVPSLESQPAPAPAARTQAPPIAPTQLGAAQAPPPPATPPGIAPQAVAAPAPRGDLFAMTQPQQAPSRRFQGPAGPELFEPMAGVKYA
jgi:hypothetical protein